MLYGVNGQTWVLEMTFQAKYEVFVFVLNLSVTVAESVPVVEVALQVQQVVCLTNLVGEDNDIITA